MIVIVNDTPLKVALLGCGNVGSQVARLLLESPADLRARTGRRIELIGIAVRHPDAEREGIASSLLTGDAAGLVTKADIVVEVIGGIEPPRALILSAIDHGASVVTANKTLLAAHGPELFAAAKAKGVDLYFEAAVAGAIPIIRPLRESLVGDQILRVTGIVNGTTNYILDEMTTGGLTFSQALTQAQELGYAEADPTADIEGYDAAAKASILASLAFHTEIAGHEVHREGITTITPEDIAAAASLGHVVKLLAVAALTENGTERVSVRVHPAMVPNEHPLAAVRGAYNAIFVESRNAGRLMFLGPGAGGAPTASAVMGDLVTVARHRDNGAPGPALTPYTHRGVAPIGDARTRYYVSLHVKDAPGVLARVASVFAKHGVSISAVRQTQLDNAPAVATLGIMTHAARDAEVQATLAELRTATQAVAGRIRHLRVEGG
ncbi:MAG: homoserine dehydrogenase [Propionibacteriaceae bacterium]|jgi:homoserine dehydrogenase|nr:homoserine dehydrogenase [Propionibacteriaceae bacterium]